MSPLPSLLSALLSPTRPGCQRFPAVRASITAVEVRLLQLPIREMLVASHGGHRVRELTVVRLDAETVSGSVVGWGECSALPTAGYWPETAVSSFDVLANSGSDLVGTRCADLLGARSLGEHKDAPSGHNAQSTPMAYAAVEMAIVDLVLAAADIPLAKVLGATTNRVSAGATVGMADPTEVADRADALIKQGFSRLKLKIEPGHDLDLMSALDQRLGPALRDGNISIQVDANGSYGPTHIDLLVQLAQCGVHVIEQPFAIEQTGAARELRHKLSLLQIPTLVLVDETATTVEKAVESVESGAADGVVAKPARLGGIDATMQLLNHAAVMGFPVSVGGMLESGLGRHCMAAVAAAADAATATLTGDLSPARRWLADDPWPDVELRVIDGRAVVQVPRGPGVAPPPDPEKLERYTAKLWRTSTDG